MLTGMERIKTLTSLRLPTIELPDDFNELELDKQVCRFVFVCLLQFTCHYVNESDSVYMFLHKQDNYNVMHVF